MPRCCTHSNKIQDRDCFCFVLLETFPFLLKTGVHLSVRENGHRSMTALLSFSAVDADTQTAGLCCAATKATPRSEESEAFDFGDDLMRENVRF
ncbi:hypothetical protein CDAR_490861 [Caerostris darwini]|uniref:Uncharacterized protein n=1 Tax=Caerostris darwini TaxID=1538125 RepID=A0AAV4NJ95_9ARAC|nr:hypothetical protein CDAR_490861 [Caerostris darwini]